MRYFYQTLKYHVRADNVFLLCIFKPRAQRRSETAYTSHHAAVVVTIVVVIIDQQEEGSCTSSKSAQIPSQT